jgi:hypothetical protein
MRFCKLGACLLADLADLADACSLCSHEELKHRGKTEERQRITEFLLNLHTEMAEIECNEISLCVLISHVKLTSNSVKLCVKNFGNLSFYRNVFSLIFADFAV